jgi:hypothetical protein
MQDLWNLTKEAMPFVGPLVSGLVAAFLVHVLSRARDREARRAEREGLIAERRTAFQRETLLAVQDETMRLIKAARRIKRLADLQAPNSTDIPDEIWDKFSSPRDRVLILKARIRDAGVREQLEQLDDLCLGSTGMLSLSEGDRKAAMNTANKTHEALNEKIGEALAALDTLEQTK